MTPHRARRIRTQAPTVLVVIAVAAAGIVFAPRVLGVLLLVAALVRGGWALLNRLAPHIVDIVFLRFLMFGAILCTGKSLPHNALVHGHEGGKWSESIAPTNPRYRGQPQRRAQRRRYPGIP